MMIWPLVWWVRCEKAELSGWLEPRVVYVSVETEPWNSWGKAISLPPTPHSTRSGAAL